MTAPKQNSPSRLEFEHHAHRLAGIGGDLILEHRKRTIEGRDVYLIPAEEAEEAYRDLVTISSFVSNVKDNLHSD